MATAIPRNAASTSVAPASAAVANKPAPAAGRGALTVTMAVIAFLFFYAVAFPKGGIKIAEIPLTFGYIFTTALALIALLRAGGLALPLDRLLVFVPCLLLGVWSAFVVVSNGAVSIGFTMAYFVSVLYLPLFGLLFFSSLILDEHIQLIEKTLLWAIRFVVVYGIFLFFYRQFTGSWIEIPYLTVNADDLGQLDDKFINRGGVFKLISTYNNGNILGVCMAILAPLYLKLENRRYLQWAFYAAMFLTLSRTVWIAAVMIIFLRSLSKGVRPLGVIYMLGGLLLTGFIIGGLLSFLGVDLAFVFDSNLGGRLYLFDTLNDVRIFPDERVAPLPEIVYLGVLNYFGIPGLLLFLAHLLVPSLLLMAEGTRVLSLSKASACLQGLLMYAIIACADAAFSFIPVMMFFWTVVGLGFWYAHRRASPVRSVREAVG